MKNIKFTPFQRFFQCNTCGTIWKGDNLCGRCGSKNPKEVVARIAYENHGFWKTVIWSPPENYFWEVIQEDGTTKKIVIEGVM